MTALQVSPAWLALREPADAAARASALIDELRCDLPCDRLLVHDLACGTGSMFHWLAPQLPGPQHWVCYDLDGDLLTVAGAAWGRCAADGSPVRVDVRQRDVTRLAGECTGAALITASALLDVLTGEELDRLVETCVAAHCPALLTLSVNGQVELWPPDPLDAAVGAAFNAHQRRGIGVQRLLGPDAPEAAARAFRGAGYEVLSRPSPWRLDGAARALTTTWFTGWLAAAREQRPELEAETTEYARRRLADAAAGRLRVLVDHCDLLARPARRRVE